MAVTQRRKLLTAAVGVATVSYVVACGGLSNGGETSGNLMSPIGRDGQGGALAAGGTTPLPEQGGSGGYGGYGGGVTSGNLMGPPPPLGGSGGAPGAVDAGLSDAGPSENGGDADAEPGDAALDSGS